MSMPDTVRKKFDIHTLIVIIIAFAFYGFFAIFDGAVMCADTMTYINMDMSREPFYPLFLAGLRTLFGEEHYLFACACIQSLLAAAASVSLVFFLRRTFKLGPVQIYLSLCILLGVSLLCRFAAGRASMYSNSILSEGIAVAGFILFFRYLADYMLSGKWWMLAASVLISLILISTRKQMYLTLMLTVIAMFIRYIRSDKTDEEHRRGNMIRCFMLIVLIPVIILAATRGFDKLYHIRLHGESVTHSGDIRFMTTVVFYTADRDFDVHIEEPAIRALFDDIYDVCDAEGSMMHDAPEGLIAMGDHFAEHYDMIQIDHMWEKIEEYAAEMSGDNPVLREQITDGTMQRIVRAIRPYEYRRIAKLWVANFVQGLANTSARASGIMYKAGLIIWILYACIMLFRCIRSRMDDVSVFALLTFISSILNIAIVSSVIFCQTRYMIYNMPLFYISLLLMLTVRMDRGEDRNE